MPSLIPLKQLELYEFVQLQLGDQVKVSCGPSDIRVIHHVPKKVLMTYCGMARSKNSFCAAANSNDFDTLILHTHWPKTVDSFVRILIGKNLVFSRDSVHATKSGLETEYAAMETSKNPVTHCDQLVDLAVLADFLQYESTDIGNIITVELSKLYSEPSQYFALSSEQVDTMFSLPDNGNWNSAWKIIAKACAAEYAKFILIKNATLRGKRHTAATPFAYQSVFDSNLKFRVHVIEVALDLISSAVTYTNPHGMVAEHPMTGLDLVLYN